MNYVFLLLVAAIVYDKCYLRPMPGLLNYPLFQFGLGLYLNILPVCWLVSDDWRSALIYAFFFSIVFLWNLYLLYNFLILDYLYEHRYRFVDVVVPR